MGRPGPRSPYRISSRLALDNRLWGRAWAESSARGQAWPGMDKYSGQSGRAGPSRARAVPGRAARLAAYRQGRHRAANCHEAAKRVNRAGLGTLAREANPAPFAASFGHANKLGTVLGYCWS